MKFFFVLPIIFMSLIVNAQHTQHWHELYGGGSWHTDYVAGDTIHFNPGAYTYFSGANMNGDKDNPIVCLFDKGVVMNNGINLTDCSNWFINGLDKDGSYNLVIKNNPSTVGLSFKGKCNNIEIAGVYENNVYSFLWWKTEVNDFPGDTSYWHIVMDGIKLHDFKFTKGNFDGVYLGSTGQKADRPVVYNGKTYYPYPPLIKNVQIYNGVIDTTARSGLQASGVIDTGSFIKNVTIQNNGTSLEDYQGACFRIGGRSTGGFIIDNCTFKNSHLYAVHSQGGGVIKFKNNIVDSATVVMRNVNTQPMAAIEFDTYTYPTTIKIINNKIGWTNNNVGVVVYGNKTTMTDTGNVFSGNNMSGQFQNFSDVTFDTTGIILPPPPPKDTTILYFTLNYNDSSATFYRADGSTLIFNNVERCTGNIKTKKWVVYFNDKKRKQLN